MIDHVSISVRNLDEAAQFYEGVLATIGYRKLQVRPHTVGFGKSYSEFWINLRSAVAPIATAECGTHIALRARSREAPHAMAPRDRDRNTVRATMPPLFAIGTATESRR